MSFLNAGWVRGVYRSRLNAATASAAGAWFSRKVDRMPTIEIPPSIRTVLVLEDNFIIAMDAEEILKSMGISDVQIAANADQAMKLIAAQSFDFIILDVNLEDETSFAVADAILARGLCSALPAATATRRSSRRICGVSQGSTSHSTRVRSAT